jgi:hypothetical protein
VLIYTIFLIPNSPAQLMVFPCLSQLFRNLMISWDLKYDLFEVGCIWSFV